LSTEDECCLYRHIRSRSNSVCSPTNSTNTQNTARFDGRGQGGRGQKFGVGLTMQKAVLSQGNRATPQLFVSVQSSPTFTGSVSVRLAYRKRLSQTGRAAGPKKLQAVTGQAELINGYIQSSKFNFLVRLTCALLLEWMTVCSALVLRMLIVWGLITKNLRIILRLSYDVIITYDNRKSNLR